MAILMKSTRKLQPGTLIELLTKLETLKRTFTDYWISMRFDAVITPAGVLPAVPHRFLSELPFLSAHFQLYSLLDFPSGVLPVRFVQSDDLKEIHLFNQVHRSSNIERPQDRMNEYLRLGLLDSEGLPCGVQVVTRPNQDEKCLWLMEQIERIIGLNDIDLL